MAEEVFPNFRADILDAAQGQAIEGIVLGQLGWSKTVREGTPDVASVLGKLLTWEEASPLIDYAYDPGFGSGKPCHTMVAWTATTILQTVGYDGGMWIMAIPRHPKDHTPKGRLS